jgi:integrase
LKSLVQRRISNRPGDAYLFPDLPGDNNRTMAISKRFGYYRKRLGVDDTRPGAKRSKINFHSFRRWFATKVEEAGQRELAKGTGAKAIIVANVRPRAGSQK